MPPSQRKGRPTTPPYELEELKAALLNFVDTKGHCALMTFGEYDRIMEKAAVRGVALMKLLPLLTKLQSVSKYVMFTFCDLKDSLISVASMKDGIYDPELESIDDWARKVACRIQVITSHVTLIQ